MLLALCEGNPPLTFVKGNHPSQEIISVSYHHAVKDYGLANKSIVISSSMFVYSCYSVNSVVLL